MNKGYFLEIKVRNYLVIKDIIIYKKSLEFK